MADAWTAPVGERPKQPDIASIIRSAQNSTEHAGDAGLGGDAAGLDGVSFRHTDISDAVGGGSSLGRDSLGTSALSAALTLHPCVHISGVGDASREVLHAMLSQIGPVSIKLVMDEDDEGNERRTGEASATFSSADNAVEAIRRYDGSRFDDGMLHVSVAKRAAQGSLVDRKGKGKGRGKGKGGMAFSERQRDLISDQRLQLAQDEKDAFSQARAMQQASGGGRGRGGSSGGGGSIAPLGSFGATATGTAPLSSSEALAASKAAAAAKKRKLPGMMVVKPGATAPIVVGGESKAAKPTPEPVVAGPAMKPDAPAGGGLLGLAGYGSSSGSDGEDGA